jgi:hypothetical protein
MAFAKFKQLGRFAGILILYSSRRGFEFAELYHAAKFSGGLSNGFRIAPEGGEPPDLGDFVWGLG